MFICLLFLTGLCSYRRPSLDKTKRSLNERFSFWRVNKRAVHLIELHRALLLIEHRSLWIDAKTKLDWISSPIRLEWLRTWHFSNRWTLTCLIAWMSDDALHNWVDLSSVFLQSRQIYRRTPCQMTSNWARRAASKKMVISFNWTSKSWLDWENGQLEVACLPST